MFKLASIADNLHMIMASFSIVEGAFFLILWVGYHNQSGQLIYLYKCFLEWWGEYAVQTR